MVAFRVPVSTYRLQLNSAFGFQEVQGLLPYLKSLGITDVYASPVLKARHRSPHCYDLIDPTSLNPELGSEKDFDTLCDDLKRLGMGLLLDIVPNHMALSLENPWWTDVLENGRASPFARFFDMDWHHGGIVPPAGRVMLPLLSKPLGEVLESRQLALSLEDGKQGFVDARGRLGGLDGHPSTLPFFI